MKVITDPEENCERLRVLLSPKLTLPLPKTENIKKLISNIFTEEELFLLANGIKKSLRLTSMGRIRRRTGLGRKEVKRIILNMKKMGKIVKLGHFVLLPGYLPGVFELYFTPSRDDPERMKKAGEAHYEFIKSGGHVEHSAANPLFRVIPAVDPLERSIEINKSIKVKNKVLPYEIMRKYLKKYKTFAVQPCSCRSAAKFSGNPCKRTDENFCVTAGLLAKHVIRNNSGRKVNLEELLEIMKRAEKEGLIHNTSNMKKTSLFICNCCPCCCGVYKQVKELKNRAAIALTNFEPIIHSEQCTLCKVCIEKCPMDAITFLETENKNQVNLELCIGCGICASNCSNNAITLKKVRNDTKLSKGNLGVGRKMMKAGKRLRKEKAANQT